MRKQKTQVNMIVMLIVDEWELDIYLSEDGDNQVITIKRLENFSTNFVFGNFSNVNLKLDNQG